jgi:hypothetical protein
MPLRVLRLSGVDVWPPRPSVWHRSGSSWQQSAKAFPFR